MRRYLAVSLLATSMLAMPHTAMAQGEDSAVLRAELDMMRAQMAAMQKRLDALDQAAEAQQPARIIAPPAVAPASTASTAQISGASQNKPVTEVNWRGAPELKREDGWSFKPRGRAQVDFAGVNTPAGVTGERGGLRTELRRIYLGVDGKIPGGFSYRVEADLADGIELTDAYLSYGTGPLAVTVGHVKPFFGLEEMTSDLFTSMMERAAISQAFGFERRVGLSGEYQAGDILLQGGVFGASAEDLADDRNNAISADARAVWMPRLDENMMLHLGGSVHMRNFNDAAATVRYRARPGAHSSDVRLVDTGNIAAEGERSFGLEAALHRGPLHVSAEGYWQKVRRVGGPNPTFFGGYAEVGMVLTKGDSRSYRKGVFDRLKPSHPINTGGSGAIEVNLRYDHLDLNDRDILGGKQQGAWISLVWAPIEYVRLTANYGRLWISDARIAAADGDRNYGADSFGLRTQIDF